MTAWRYSINYGPEGEANYANLHAADGQFVGNLRTHHAIAICNAFAVCEKLAATPSSPVSSPSPAGASIDPRKITPAYVVAWAVDRWNEQVKNRPLVNVHRRSLDDAWRRVMRDFGGDPDGLVGPPHDELHAVCVPSPKGDEHLDLAKPSPAGGVREAIVCDAVIDHTAAQTAGLVGSNDEAQAVEAAVKRALVVMRSVFTARLSSPATPEPALAGGVRRDDPFRPAVDVDADDDYYPSREDD